MGWGGGETYPLHHGTGPGHLDPLLAGEPGQFCHSERSEGEVLEARDLRVAYSSEAGSCIFLSSLAKNVHTLSLPFPPTPTCSEKFSVRHNGTFMDAVTCTP